MEGEADLLTHRSSAVVGTAAILLLLLGSSASYAVEYHAPAAFNGHAWGDRLASFPGLTLWHANTAQGADGKVVDFLLKCKKADCSFGDATLYQRAEGGGSFALAEYYKNVDNNPWPRQDIALLTVSYLFCANVAGEYLPHPINQHLRLCGGRILFRSDTLAELAHLGAGYRSNYDRIMGRLIAEYGEPPGYERRGVVIIENIESAQQPQRPQYVLYRWCGVDEASLNLHPSCPVSITLEFEATRGYGTILYATAAVYDFAHARNEMGDRNNDLYALLFSRQLAHPPRGFVRTECTGKRICNPGSSAMTARQMKEFEP
jgi:hypothetical protein